MSLNIGDKYVDGFEAIGNVSRKRNKDLEVSDKFLPNNDKDTWGKMFVKPDSNQNFTSRTRLETATSDSKFYPISMQNFKANF